MIGRKSFLFDGAARVTSPSIAFLSRYPVKGLSPQPLEMASLTAGAHFPGDRLYAIENGPSGFDAAAPEHQAKIKYLVLMRQPALARLTTAYDDASHTLQISRGADLLASGDLRTEAGRGDIEAFFQGFFADDLRGAPRVLTAPEGYRFMDSRSGFVSLLNLASLRAIAAKVGRAGIDARRFRANIGLEGLPPWGEFDFVGREIALGEVVLRGIKRTERCAATHVDPKAGIRDIDLVGLLLRDFGHSDCGIYAEVIRGGTLRLGDTLRA